jgi:hypothetical protein
MIDNIFLFFICGFLFESMISKNTNNVKRKERKEINIKKKIRKLK